MAFLAWVAGYPLTSRVRTLLTTRYREAANASTEALEAFERGDAENLIDDAIVGPPPAGFGRYRRAYRPTAVKIAMEAISGRFDPSLYDASDIGELLKQKNTSTRAAIDDVEKRVMSGVFGIVDRSAALDAVVRLSDRQLEADRDAAVTVWSNVEAKIGGPMLFGIFEAVFVARRVSAPCRLLLRLARRQGRERGFTTLATFYQHLRAEYDASNA